eukprot:PDM83967.1 C1 domain containing protein [Pristionchus pacificus]
MHDPLEDVVSGIAIAGAVAASLYGLRLILAPIRNKSVLNEPSVAKSGHSWVIEPFFNKGYFCSICELNLTGGYSCSHCRLRVDDVPCLHLASTEKSCKVNPKTTSARRLKHHWVLGNLEPDDFCAICDEPCGEDPGLNDFWCAWCCRAVHNDCKRELPEHCDRGAHGRSIIPPNCVTLRKGGSRNQKEIMDVTRCNMGSCFRFLDEHPEINARILICGGDGTISSVLNDIEGLENRPSIAILPLGTGNDLSRILNWGTESDGRFALKEIVNLVTEIQEAEIQPLDRWRIAIETERKMGVDKVETRVETMTNYFSMGVDARVTFGMQSTRSSVPKSLSSRMINKLLFFSYGTMDLFTRTHSNLQNKIELTMDGKKHVFTEPIEGLVFLNIQCWGAGVKVWREQENDEEPQILNDKKFEIFAVRSSFHIAKLQVGLSSPIRIGQASEATIKVLNEGIHMQSDGEAWLQSPSTVTITHKCQAQMLKRVNKK